MLLTFAQTNEGQSILEDIEDFGLKGVDGASDLTIPQMKFLRAARHERDRRREKRMQQRFNN